MDGFDLTKAPPEFQAWGWTSYLCHSYTNLTWLYVYYGIIYYSYKDRSYSMPLISHCFNIAWEITFGFLFALDHWLITLTFQVATLSNLGTIYAAIRYGSQEWAHAPLIQRYLPWWYLAGIALAIAAHLALVAELGGMTACFANAIVCQAILSVGYLCQLLTRGSTRGFALNLWFFRFTGSLTLVPEFYLRVKYWPEAFGFLGKPFMLWCCAIYLGFDLAYGICFWYIRRMEQEAQRARSMLKKSG
ncbi:hypothetical protein ASPACDRAFT_120412 [Aspergillus aculeatus ATCC 16872]|uniref:Uncharacterized protein n=1 Tax=Aspergillus aculeatus (strain ATCC 16872 / CBS 172.66 / WB 5094) TaxID=690307 RepID=A0A1L9WST5_ASPA1|nr:uncharacterized protein ASPACDRAFT_120412 [Aspergillus aculeatus ATCC 16872]OJJ99235.1 hypothetical protein ASPACDRAFT_120412 [Aspergillus aculeatus ATCC 16872]